MTSKATVRKKLIWADPFGASRDAGFYQEGRWPAHWVSHPDVEYGPAVIRYRCEVRLEAETTFDLHVSGDERYELAINGQRVGRGPERGNEDHWPFETYEVVAEAGPLLIEVLVWSANELRAYACNRIRHGLLVATKGKLAEQINTGTAAWTSALLTEYEFTPPRQAWGTGGKIRFTANPETRENYVAVRKLHPGLIWDFESEFQAIHCLRPARLPAMLEQPWTSTRVRHAQRIGPGDTHEIIFNEKNHEAVWAERLQTLLDRGVPFTVPGGTRLRFLLDLDDYVCGRPEVAWRGTGNMRINWQESLFESEQLRPNDWRDMHKGHRDHIEGKRFSTIWNWSDGVGDDIIALTDGRFTSLWWHAGRFVEVVIEGGEWGLTVTELGFTETHFPYEFTDSFTSDDPDLPGIHRIAKRTLKMCSHETYMDCPYYEQLQYVGDTRLQVLVTYATTSDHRLPQQALRAFDESRRNRGITYSRFPSIVRQIIPPFSLWWVCMIHDAMRYQADAASYKRHLPGARAVLDYFATQVRNDGLLQPPPGWNFIDWIGGWKDGCPPGGQEQPTAPLNLQYLLALQSMIELETAAGEEELAARWRRHAESLQKAIRASFVAADGFVFDDEAHLHRSEHANCLAFLAGVTTADEVRKALTFPDKKKTTLYFAHYLLETYWKLGDGDGIVNELAIWRWHLSNGLRTTIEMPEPTRSDCHAWGAHPVYHTYASLLGIRPTSAGFRTALIQPAASGKMQRISGSTPTPFGPISVSIEPDHLHVEIPKGIQAEVNYRNVRATVGAGLHSYKLS